VREARSVPADVSAMREELEKLRTESNTMRQRIDELQKA